MKRIVILAFFFGLVFTGFLCVKQVSAGPIPPPGNIPCSTRPKNPEFHSQRPYQKSPLSKCIAIVNDKARFCGNDLLLQDTVQVDRGGAVSCQSIGANKEECQFDISREFDVAIDLSGVELPIVGNTENVKNSQEFTPDPFLTDADRVNEYVGWYLNGSFIKPEEDYIDPLTDEGGDQIVNYSGPIKKLLPLDEKHKKQINSVIASVEDDRHNQIVVCADDKAHLGPIPLGGKQPKECYKREGKRAKDEYRLSYWNGKIVLKLVANVVTKLMLKFAPDWLKPLINEDLIYKNLANVWEYKVPPLRENFDEGVYYRKAYNEWQGDVCAVIPIPIINFKFLFCIDHPLIPNKYADLFPYVPLSSYETSSNNPSSRTDRKGKARGQVPGEQQYGDLRVYDILFEDQSPANLFFPHVQEVAGLAEILQSIYSAEGQPTTGEASDTQPALYCDLTEVRTNPGDNLFAGEMTGKISYSAQFPCEFETAVETGRVCSLRRRCPDRMNCLNGKCWTRGNDTCTKVIPISMSVITFTPKADEIWQRLVSGPAAAFKRIFPKAGWKAPVEAILDIPAATKVSYTGEHLAAVGNPGNQRDLESAELYWPHFGGVYEYFLKGIQTALRPKGYGEPILSGSLKGVSGCTPNEVGSIPDLPKASGACKLHNTGSKYRSITPLPPTLINIFEAAGETFQIPPSMLLAIMFGEGAFDRNWEWTEENVKNWSKECALMPDCNPEDPAGQGAFAIFEQEWDDGEGVQTIDPDRVATRCNLLDEVFNVARKVSRESWGWGGYPPPQSCFGITYNTGSNGPTSCSDWDPNDIVTGFRQWAGACVSTENSCLLGISAGTCPEDNCEQYSQCFEGEGGCTSHIHCSWDVFNHYR